MQTVTQSPSKGESQIVASSPTQHHVKWNGQVVGMIQCSPELGLKWDYTRYSEYPKAFVGTYDECVEAAQADYDAAHQPEAIEATVTHIANDSKPAYVHRRTSWRVSGSHNEVTVTVQVDDEVYEVLTPTSFARSLTKGSVVELFPDKYTGRLCIRWTRKPVRRTVVAA